MYEYKYRLHIDSDGSYRIGGNQVGPAGLKMAPDYNSYLDTTSSTYLPEQLPVQSDTISFTYYLQLTLHGAEEPCHTTSNTHVSTQVTGQKVRWPRKRFIQLLYIL